MPFPNIGPGELILILIIALVVLGPGKLPDVASSLGKSVREFRKAASDVTDAGKLDTLAQAPAPPAAPAQAQAAEAPAPATASPVSGPAAVVAPPPAEPAQPETASTPAAASASGSEPDRS